MFGIEKYLISVNIVTCVIASFLLGLFIHNTNTKNVDLISQHYNSIVDASQVIANNQKAFDVDLTSLQNNLKALQNNLSVNHSATLKNNEDLNNRINDVNNNINSINDKFRKLPRPIVCQFLN